MVVGLNPFAVTSDLLFHKIYGLQTFKDWVLWGRASDDDTTTLLQNLALINSGKDFILQESRTTQLIFGEDLQ